MATQKLREGGSPLSTLMFAWVLVVGMTFAPVGTYVHQTGDVRVLLAFLGASFLVGASLLIAMGLARLGARSRPTEEQGPIADLHARGGLFGRR